MPLGGGRNELRFKFLPGDFIGLAALARARARISFNFYRSIFKWDKLIFIGVGGGGLGVVNYSRAFNRLLIGDTFFLVI